MTGLEPLLLFPAKLALAKLAGAGGAKLIHEIADSQGFRDLAADLGMSGARDLAHDLGDVIDWLFEYFSG